MRRVLDACPAMRAVRHHIALDGDRARQLHDARGVVHARVHRHGLIIETCSQRLQPTLEHSRRRVVVGLIDRIQRMPAVARHRENRVGPALRAEIRYDIIAAGQRRRQLLAR